MIVNDFFLGVTVPDLSVLNMRDPVPCPNNATVVYFAERYYEPWLTSICCIIGISFLLSNSSSGTVQNAPPIKTMKLKK